jgi:deazaflavin-dependent oxidoreductase (nitroreductase family)
VLVASFGGGPKNPAWYHNLKANPDVVVREKARVFWVHAEELAGTERADAWPVVVADSPWYGEYQQRAARSIPLVRLREVGDYR